MYTSKKLSKAIVGHRNQNGEFDCAEQLLDIQSIEQHHIEKLIEKLLISPEEELERVSKDKQMMKSFSRDIIPRPDLDEFMERMKPRITGIHLTLQGLTFAQISGGSLLDWNTWDLKEDLDFDPAANVSYKHRNLFSVCRNFLSNESCEIPASDYMILEESLPLLPKDPYLKPKINLLKLRTTLMTMMMMDHPLCHFHTVKPSVFDSIVNLKQGNERISVRDKLSYSEGQINTRHGEEEREEFLLNCDESLWKNPDGFMSKRSLQKDYLGLALLKASAFEKLCLLTIDKKHERERKK